jgi:hypothetical protein
LPFDAASAGAAPAASFEAGCPAPSSSVRTTCPTLIFSPALTRISLTVPATFDGTSMVALSVSSSSTA